MHRNSKKGMQTFETEDISPYLASVRFLFQKHLKNMNIQLSNSCVPMPGQESVEFDRVVSISRVARQVTILPTKTRPKKLGFVGSDGKQLVFFSKFDIFYLLRIFRFSIKLSYLLLIKKNVQSCIFIQRTRRSSS